MHAHDDDRASVNLRRELIRLLLIVAVERPQPERARVLQLRGLAQQAHGGTAVEISATSSAWRLPKRRPRKCASWLYVERVGAGAAASLQMATGAIVVFAAHYRRDGLCKRSHQEAIFRA